MKKIFIILLYIYPLCSQALDIDLYGDKNETYNSLDVGIDIVTEKNNFFLSSGFYRFSNKNYEELYAKEGSYFGVGKYFKLNNDLDISANAKYYTEEDKPVYCIKLVQRFSVF